MSRTLLFDDMDKYPRDDMDKYPPIISPETYTNLILFKNKIDNLDNNKVWDRAKKLSNDYELIHLPNKKNKKNSIALYEPLSRSYFKMWEMIHEFDLLNISDPVNILCLAEGPGGFIEAIVNSRNKIEDTIYGITLKSTDKDIPGWKKSRNFLKNNENVVITYGADGTGNLYNLENIKYLKNTVKKAFLITADGGFDFSLDFNNQESLSYRIILCEIVTALAIQQNGGNFVCKIFDIYTIVTARLIYILTMYYDQIFITKPLTSRPANSEKYIICKGFKGINDVDLDNLYDIIGKWDLNIGNDLLNNIIIPNNFMIKLNSYNEYITNIQIDNIKQTLYIIENEENISNITKIIETQKIKAVSWCNNYKIAVNTQSSYITGM
jgi:23S rRNA U2552 (ribose-2'-O)-methylase RlmE/FtsJ